MTMDKYLSEIEARIQQYKDGFIHDFEFVLAVTTANAMLDMNKMKADYQAEEQHPIVEEPPIQYWALYLEGIGGSRRVIAPFFTQKEADDYALSMASKGEMNNIVWYTICTENSCEHGSK